MFKAFLKKYEMPVSIAMLVAATVIAFVAIDSMWFTATLMVVFMWGFTLQIVEGGTSNVWYFALLTVSGASFLLSGMTIGDYVLAAGNVYGIALCGYVLFRHNKAGAYLFAVVGLAVVTGLNLAAGGDTTSTIWKVGEALGTLVMVTAFISQSLAVFKMPASKLPNILPYLLFAYDTFMWLLYMANKGLYVYMIGEGLLCTTCLVIAGRIFVVRRNALL